MTFNLNYEVGGSHMVIYCISLVYKIYSGIIRSHLPAAYPASLHQCFPSCAGKEKVALFRQINTLDRNKHTRKKVKEEG